MIGAVLALLLPSLRDLAEEHASALIQQGIELVERLISGEASDAEAIAWLKQYAREA